MKFLDSHIKNVVYGVVSFLIAFYIFKFAGVTVDAGFWLLFIMLVFIYIEILDKPKKK